MAADEHGRYRLTLLGDHLRSDARGSLHAMALPRGAADYAPWGRLADTVRTGQPGFEHAFGTDFFAHLSRDDAAALRFDHFMVAAARSTDSASSTGECSWSTKDQGVTFQPKSDWSVTLSILSCHFHPAGSEYVERCAGRANSGDATSRARGPRPVPDTEAVGTGR